MKVKVISAFYDLTENRDYPFDYEFDFTEEKVEKFREFIEIIDTEPATNEEVDYDKLKVDELKAMLNEKGIEFDDNLKKAELIKLLRG